MATEGPTGWTGANPRRRTCHPGLVPVASGLLAGVRSPRVLLGLADVTFARGDPDGHGLIIEGLALQVVYLNREACLFSGCEYN